MSCLLVLHLKADAQEPAREIAVSEINAQQADSTVWNGAFPGALLIPNAPKTGKDEKYGNFYPFVVLAYRLEQSGRYARRFRVYAADAESLPFARQVARSLLLLHNLLRERLNYDHPSITPVVNVWLTRKTPDSLEGDTGGEQLRNDIYFYSVATTRTPIEWAREFAHEYSHFGLPGISGFTYPEEWGNGYLGEHLFLKWIAEEMKSGRASSDDFPLCSKTELERYKQTDIAPLIHKVADLGVDAKRIAVRDKGQIGELIAAVLFVDETYGSKFLRTVFAEMQEGPHGAFPHAEDFLRGLLGATKSSRELTLASTPGRPFLNAWLSAGKYRIASIDGGTSVLNSGKTLKPGGTLIILKSAWTRLDFRPSGSTKPVRVKLARVG